MAEWKAMEDVYVKCVEQQRQAFVTLTTQTEDEATLKLLWKNVLLKEKRWGYTNLWFMNRVLDLSPFSLWV